MQNADNSNLTIPDWTASDYLTSAPYEWLYQYRDNQFLMMQLRDMIRIKAGEVKVKNFINKFNVYCKQMAKQTGERNILRDNVTQFADQPLELFCNDYVCDDFGVTGIDRYGNEIIICRHPIMPISRMVNVDTGEIKLEIAFKRGGRWRTVILGRDVLASTQKILELARYGVAADSENAKGLVKYITFMESENYDKLGETNSVGRLGWIGDYGFSPYVEGLRYDGDLSYQHMFDSVKEKGSFETWRALMLTARKDSTIARIQLAASFASVLVDPLGCLPFFVHVWGGTEAGKTVGLMVAASVWANPAMGEYIHTFNATPIGQEMAAGFVNSLPLCIDELQIVKDRKNFDSIVYMLTEGIGRSRGAKTGGLQKIKTWRNCIMSTGEMPISAVHSGGGAVNRIIEVDCKDEKLFKDPRYVANTIRQNYGLAGPMFVKMLDSCLDECKRVYSQLYAKLSSGESTEKQASAAALVLTADRMIEELIFQDGKTLSIADMEKHLTTKKDVSQNERALDWIFDFVASNPAKFRNEANYNGDRWGEVNNDYVYIIKAVFDKQMSEAGFNPTSFLSWAKQRGILSTNANRMVKKKRIIGTDVCAWCVCIRLDAASDGGVEMEDLPDNIDVPF